MVDAGCGFCASCWCSGLVAVGEYHQQTCTKGGTEPISFTLVPFNHQSLPLTLTNRAGLPSPLLKILKQELERVLLGHYCSIGIGQGLSRSTSQIFLPDMQSVEGVRPLASTLVICRALDFIVTTP